ncbi:MAG: glycosyltransferase family 39 protein [Saprospiraceae bacterium]|jgi:4-amino-4-deoxy-L-arabinose transferase-like glycosyltransferase|nr:glycosyltransferase family 39 protein [Saprospiraceae bacterium]
MASRTSLFIALIGALFYLPWLGGVHLFDWDEINFAEIAREMMLTKDYLRVYIDYRPFWEKPPLFIWMQLMAMKSVGVGEYAARLPNAICGIITLVLLYRMGRKLYDHSFGLIWALVYFGTVLPFLYFKSGIIDPYFNLFIFLGMYYFILAYWKKDQFELDLPKNYWWYLFLGGFFIGLGILTKGPVALVISCLVFFVYWVYQRFRFYINVPQFLFFLVAASFITLAWFGIETLKNGPWYITTFTKYQYELFSKPVAGHRGFPGYHFVVVLVGCFPASLFAIRAFAKMPAEQQRYRQDFKRWMIFLFWTVLILFTIVKSKIVHYSSMSYFPVTFLASLTIYHIIHQRIAFSRWIKAGIWAIGTIFILVTLALPILAQQIDALKPLFKDPFAQANLEAQVRWTGFEVIPGIFLLALLIVSTVLWRRNQLETGIRVLFIGTSVFVMLTLIFYIKRIEGYSQRAAIEFYESKAQEDCYIVTHGYKSYAHLFYARKRPVTDERSYDKEWLLNGEIDKPVYVVTKIHKADEMKAYPKLERLGGKNGFVFFGRKPEE